MSEKDLLLSGDLAKVVNAAAADGSKQSRKVLILLPFILPPLLGRQRPRQMLHNT